MHYCTHIGGCGSCHTKIAHIPFALPYTIYKIHTPIPYTFVPSALFVAGYDCVIEASKDFISYQSLYNIHLCKASQYCHSSMRGAPRWRDNYWHYYSPSTQTTQWFISRKKCKHLTTLPRENITEARVPIWLPNYRGKASDYVSHRMS